MIKEKYCPKCRFIKYKTRKMSINNCPWCDTPLALREVLGKGILIVGIVSFIVGIITGIFIV